MDHRIAEEAAQLVERSILNGLSALWDSLLLELNAICRNLTTRLSKPGLMLLDMNLLGKWDPQVRLIIMQRKFVFTSPWDAVVDVFKHEMAHQVAHEMLGAVTEVAHGPAFREACHLLRADPRSSAEYQTLQDYIREGKASEADRIMDKVNKLLALAQSPSEHEAREAMRKAHELMRAYNLESIEKRPRRSHFSMFLGRPALRNPPETSLLAGLLREFYFVETIWIQAWVIEKNAWGRVLEISGTSENLAMADYVFAFVNRYIEGAWDEFRRRSRVSGRRRQSDFAAGVIKGFREVLGRDEVMKNAGKDTSALILARDAGLNAYYKHRYPRIRNRAQTARNTDPAVIEAGKEAGRKLRLHRGIHDTSSGPVKLLTGQ